MQSSSDDDRQRQAKLRTIDNVVRRIDRPIWVVTAAAVGQRSGLLATWVAAASIDPEQPLMMVGIAPNHLTCKLVMASGAVALHLVDAENISNYMQFCLSSGGVEDKFSSHNVKIGKTGSPLLVGSLASLDCQVVDAWDTGDRIFFIVEPIEATNSDRPSRPATEADLLTAAKPEQRDRLRASLQNDLIAQRPLRAAWRARLAGRSGIPPERRSAKQ